MIQLNIVFGLFFVLGAGLELRNGAYDDFVIQVNEGVPIKDCRIVLDNVEVRFFLRLKKCLC